MPSFMTLTNEAFRLERHSKNTPPAKPAFLVSARRDSAAFQIIVQSDLHYSLNVGRSEWFSTGGRLQGPHNRLRLSVEAPFPITLRLEDLLTDDDRIQKADILLNQNVREELPNTPSAVWAEVRIPESAPAGEYIITVRLFSALYGEDETLVDIQSIPLQVFFLHAPRSPAIGISI